MGGMRPSHDYDIRIGPPERTVRFQEGKLFLGGLDESITTRDINEYCCQWGEVTDSVVMDAKNYGFVTFRDPACAMAFLEQRDHVIRGRRVDAKAAVPKHLGGNARLTRKLFVGGTKNLRTEEFVEHFSRFGKIEDAVIVHREGVSRGFGFVTFSDEISVEKCLVVAHTISGKKVELKRAIPKEEMEAAEHAAAAAKAAAAQAAAYGAAAGAGGFSPPPPGAGFYAPGPPGGAAAYMQAPGMHPHHHPGGGYSPVAVPMQFAAAAAAAAAHAHAASSSPSRGGGGGAGGAGGGGVRMPLASSAPGGGGGSQEAYGPAAAQHHSAAAAAYGWGPTYYSYPGHHPAYAYPYGGYAMHVPYGMGYAPAGAPTGPAGGGGWQQQQHQPQEPHSGGRSRGGGGGGVAALQQQMGQMQVAGGANAAAAAAAAAMRLPEHLQPSPPRPGGAYEVAEGPDHASEDAAGGPSCSSEELEDERPRDQRRGGGGDGGGGGGGGGKPQPPAAAAEVAGGDSEGPFACDLASEEAAEAAAA